MNYKNYRILKKKKYIPVISMTILLSIFLTGCHQDPVYIETRNNKPVTNNEILHVDITDEEADLSAVYLLNEENRFASSFISKYDIGIHSKAYKIKLKIEYLDNIQIIDYTKMPSSKTITNLYVTMDNYDFIVALFNGTELISKGVFDISVLNQENQPLKCMAGKTDKTHIIGFGQELSNDLVVYKTELSVIHGDEEWNANNDEKIALSVFLEDD